MSKFLAPIHSWLFNKIQISEALETNLLDVLQLQDSPYVADLYAQVGPLLPDAPIEDLIDQGNIHGWLQNRINMTESRLAALITWQLGENPAVNETLHQVWRATGKSIGASMNISQPVSAEVAYKLVQDILLEGMPCDRVNEIASASENQVEWVTTRCLHQPFFHVVGGDVSNYYALRESFINGFLETIQPGASYNVKAASAESGAAYRNQLTIQ